MYMERNSRDFKQHISIIDFNTEAVSPAIKEIFYPKYITPENYNHCLIKDLSSVDGKAGGYGGLFSLTCTSMAASTAFFLILHLNISTTYNCCQIKDLSSWMTRQASWRTVLVDSDFTSMAASTPFFDDLPCHKGPSLGTSIIVVYNKR